MVAPNHPSKMIYQDAHHNVLAVPLLQCLWCFATKSKSLYKASTNLKTIVVGVVVVVAVGAVVVVVVVVVVLLLLLLLLMMLLLLLLWLSLSSCQLKD